MHRPIWWFCVATERWESAKTQTKDTRKTTSNHNSSRNHITECHLRLCTRSSKRKVLINMQSLRAPAVLTTAGAILTRRH